MKWQTKLLNNIQYNLMSAFRIINYLFTNPCQKWRITEYIT